MAKNKFCLRGHDTRVCGRTKTGNCKECTRDRLRKLRIERPDTVRGYNQHWYSRNRTQILAKQRIYETTNRFAISQTKWMRRINKNFGLTPTQYGEMLRLQNNVCAICGHPPKTRRLAVEHDHKTGRVRGLTCHRCNRILIGRNTVETARKILVYLESDFDGRKL